MTAMQFLLKLLIEQQNIFLLTGLLRWILWVMAPVPQFMRDIKTKEYYIIDTFLRVLYRETLRERRQ